MNHLSKTNILLIFVLLIFCSCGKEIAPVKNIIPPNVSLKYPFDKGEIRIGQNLKWEGLDYNGETLTYDLYFGTSASSLSKIAENISETEYACKELSLEEEHTYYWKVSAINSGGATDTEVWQFSIPKTIEAVDDPNALARVYSGSNYTGDCISMNNLSYDLTTILDMGGSENANMSVKIKYGYNLTMYEKNNFGGKYYVMANDDNSLVDEGFAKNASSYKVEKTPVWKMITLVLTNINMDKDGKHYEYTMSEERKNAYVKTAKSVPSIFKEWSNNQAVVEMDVVVVEDPVTDMYKFGSGYYPHTAAIKDIMDKHVPENTYGSLFLCIDMGPVKRDGWAGLGMGPCSGSKGATYACMAVTGVGAWVHEWLHGAEDWFNTKWEYLDFPDPHENGQFGYTSDVTPSWDIWYKAHLCGDDLKRNGKYVGCTGEVWKIGGPNSKK